MSNQLASPNVASEAIETINGMITGFAELLPLIAIAIVVFLIFWFIASTTRKMVERYAERSENHAGAAVAFSRLAYFAIMILGLLIAVTIAFPTITPAKMFSALGIGGVAIGFAFKDIFQNLLAGILILVRQPFRVGDEISSGDFTGTVEKIETRATFIRTYDGRRIIVPNSNIYTEPVTVITAYGILRSEYDVGIGYGDDVAEARKLALEAVKAVDGVLADPAPDVLLWDLAGFSQNLRVRWWTDPKRASVVQVKDRVLEAVAKKLSAASIDLPFPTSVVLLHDQTEETDGDRTRQREGWPAGANPPSARPIGARSRAME
ncbi:mechanosensitive ion channel family protein [Erythrobacter sp. R86502]|uniref:mechanosensitive ion channel family protein n=1 Tax=Erythrobacter sp. R86502 TaxID=3093846 RepID=UPI0036D3A5E5